MAEQKTTTEDCSSKESVPTQAVRKAGVDLAAKGDEKPVRSEPDSDSEDDAESEIGKPGASAEPGTDNLSRLRREKRLAMNRESARARRKRKKILIETLEQQVSELTRSNKKYKHDNEQLVLRVDSLTERLTNQEKELILLRSMVGRDNQTRRPALPPILGSLPSALTVSAAQSPKETPQRSMGQDAASMATDLSLRQLLHAQAFDRAANGAVGLAGLATGHGISSGVASNRAIDPHSLGRIGGNASMGSYYEPHLASQVRSLYGTLGGGNAGVGAALQGQNSLTVPSTAVTSSNIPGMNFSQIPMSGSSESSRGAASEPSLGAPNDATTALLLERLIQQQQQRRLQGDTRPYYVP